VRDFPAVTWLFAWVCGVALFLGPIFIVNLVSAVRSLRRSGIPHPYFVVARKILRLLPFRAIRPPSIEQRLVFLAWDRRWMDCGKTTARVIDAKHRHG